MGLFDSTTTTSGSPWSPLTTPTMTGVNQALALLNRGPYGGLYTAPTDPFQTGAIAAGANAAGGADALSQAFQNAGSALLPGIGSAFNYYNSALGGGSSNPWLTNTQDYLGLAGQVANNPYTQGMVQAAMRDPFRQLVEQTMPGIRMGANAAGQAGGSQEAVMAAIADRGYQDRLADTTSSIMGNFYGQGLGIADTAANFDAGQRAGAAGSLMNAGLGGLGLLNQGYGIGQQGATDLFNWGTQNQNLQNQQLQAAMQQFYAPWDVLKSYGSYVNPLAGSLRTTTESQNGLNAFLLSGLGPVLGSAGGAIGGKIEDIIKNSALGGIGNAIGGAIGDLGSGAWNWLKGIFGG